MGDRPRSPDNPGIGRRPSRHQQDDPALALSSSRRHLPNRTPAQLSFSATGWTWVIVHPSEATMRHYGRVSGIFFALLAIVQLVRVLLHWPVQVASVSVPLWASALAFIVAASLALWAFRTASALRPQ
jgi:hypothetical protein